MYRQCFISELCCLTWLWKWKVSHKSVLTELLHKTVLMFNNVKQWCSTVHNVQRCSTVHNVPGFHPLRGWDLELSGWNALFQWNLFSTSSPHLILTRKSSGGKVSGEICLHQNGVQLIGSLLTWDLTLSGLFCFGWIYFRISSSLFTLKPHPVVHFQMCYRNMARPSWS